MLRVNAHDLVGQDGAAAFRTGPIQGKLSEYREEGYRRTKQAIQTVQAKKCCDGSTTRYASYVKESKHTGR